MNGRRIRTHSSKTFSTRACCRICGAMARPWWSLRTMTNISTWQIGLSNWITVNWRTKTQMAMGTATRRWRRWHIENVMAAKRANDWSVDFHWQEAPPKFVLPGGCVHVLLVNLD